MLLFIDCEFNSMDGDLISLALVGEDGNQEFYEVVECHQTIHPWVQENVVPHLDKAALTRATFQNKLQHFLKKFPSVTVMADYPADLRYLMHVVETGPGEWMMIQPLTLEIDDRLSAKASKVPHNALSDARALRDSWLALEGGLE